MLLESLGERKLRSSVLQRLPLLIHFSIQSLRLRKEVCL